MAEPEVTKRKPVMLILIESDPRTSSRPAEAIRVAAGIGVWQQVKVNVVLRHVASHACTGSVAELADGRLFKQFIPMVRESGGEVYVQADDETMQTIDGDTLMKRNIKDSRLIELTAEADYLLRF